MKRINRRILLGFFLAALLIALIIAPTPGCEPGPDPDTEITRDDALEILVSDIIQPAAEYRELSAFMLSQPLQDGDIVTSESGETYTIDGNTWFIFIDDHPMAFFAHDCRYVFINAQTGAHDVVDETWPPDINDHSMWDTLSIGRGDMINLYSVLDSAVAIGGIASTAPAGDYGDAPDEQDAYWGVSGRFPTLYNTTNSHFDRPGAHTMNTGQEMLGLHVSVEVDATDPADPDGMPNLVDADSDERIFVIVEGTQAKLAFTVTVDSNAPAVTRYANALLDFDQDGGWSEGAHGDEWVVANLGVDVAPGSSETAITPWFSWGNQSTLSSPVWMRLLLAREQVDQSLFANVGGWDGSGQFQYGEVEDYFVFLTGQPALPEYALWPPTPGLPPRGNGQPPGNGAEPPGPETGPCGYDVQYHIITISGGDSSRDIANGTPIVQHSVDTMTALAGEQGYTSAGNLGPGSNSMADIGAAFDNLAANVKCGDHVLIYICGHGKKGGGGGIALKDAGGRTQDEMKPQGLQDLLSKIPPCPDEDCDVPGKCCSVTVIIESCYAGNFNVPGLNDRQGTTVIGTSANTPSWATHSGGGVYTQGFDKDSRNPDSDTDGDDAVDPAEANVTAVGAVNDFNSARGTSQAPWISSGPPCECKCPCEPGIDADKWVWDGLSQEWVDEIMASPGLLVHFRLEIENDGECRDIAEPKMVDVMDACLEYLEGTSLVSYGGESWPMEPLIDRGSDGTTLTWDFAPLGLMLSPGDTLSIEFEAIAWEFGENTNVLMASAVCTYDPEVVVSDEATAVVIVVEG